MRSVTQVLWSQRAVCPVPLREQGWGFYSRLFLRVKPSGAHRLIVNLNPLNRAVVYRKFTIQSIYSIRTLIPPNAYLASLDIKDAYLHVPIAESHQQYLRFALQDGRVMRHFQFRALPFGLAPAPQIFTKILAEVMAQLRTNGMSIIPYLNDLLIFGDTPASVSQGVRQTTDLLHSLGWVINQEKPSPQPTQRTVSLGYIIDTVAQKTFLTEERVTKLVARSWGGNRPAANAIERVCLYWS